MVGKVVLTALRHVWEVLQPLQISMALAGGLALANWKHPRSTYDIDLLLAPVKTSSCTDYWQVG